MPLVSAYQRQVSHLEPGKESKTCATFRKANPLFYFIILNKRESVSLTYVHCLCLFYVYVYK